MTSDLVKRLREYSFSLYTNEKKARTLDAAADRIEALERERDKLNRRIHDQRNLMRAAIGMPPEQYDSEQP